VTLDTVPNGHTTTAMEMTAGSKCQAVKKLARQRRKVFLHGDSIVCVRVCSRKRREISSTAGLPALHFAPGRRPDHHSLANGQP